MPFSDFSLLPTLVDSLAAQAITDPTDIQQRTLPELLGGASLVGVAETGSGKTLAYVLPMLHKLKTLENNGSAVSKNGHPRGVVLVPTRELGEQVCKVFKTLTHSTRMRVRSVLGGAARKIAKRNVNGAFEVMVATPGRLTQLLDDHHLHLADVRMVVFDEADQMLDPGFRPVARRIVRACPHSAQVVMFSATLPKELEATAADLFHTTPVYIRTRGSRRLVKTLRVENRQVTDGVRFDVLQAIFKKDKTSGTVLFANTRAQVDQVAAWLEDLGVSHLALRGELDPKEQRANLQRFRDGEVHALLTTDLGGRGLDIDRVERVINVHLPKDLDNYLHRAGRTARAGRDGLVINLVTGRDQDLMNLVKRNEGG